MRIVPTLIIHGGAGSKIPNATRRNLLHQKLAKILDPAYSVLLKQGALNAVVHAVKLLEDDPECNAGRGSGLQADGVARLTASVMDGHQGRFAAVLDLENIANPILIAEKLLKEKYRVLAGAGAQKFALANGFILEDVRTKQAIAQFLSFPLRRPRSTAAPSARPALSQAARKRESNL